MNYQVENIIIVYGIVIVFWASVTIWREMNKRDIKILRKEIFGLNGWSVLHFINYFFLGYLASNYVIHVIILGTIFELMEVPLGMYVSKYIDAKFIKDTIVNSVGAISGYLIYKKYPKKVKLRNLMNEMFVHF